VDADGEVISHTIYDPWGNPLTATYPDANFSGIDNRSNYTGYSWDEVLGLYYAQARFYDSEAHRFISEDPVRDGINWYVYCENGPIDNADPTGLLKVTIGGKSVTSYVIDGKICLGVASGLKALGYTPEKHGTGQKYIVKKGYGSTVYCTGKVDVAIYLYTAANTNNKPPSVSVYGYTWSSHAGRNPKSGNAEIFWASLPNGYALKYDRFVELIRTATLRTPTITIDYGDLTPIDTSKLENGTKVATYGGVSLYKHTLNSVSVISAMAGMTICADGSPRAYHPDDIPQALDHLANAGSSGNWYGIATDENGKPYIQGENGVGGPYPGYYVSTTALTISGKKDWDTTKYVNSELVPYIVRSGKDPNMNLGDFAYVYNTKNGKWSFAIVGEDGPQNEFGEGSIALQKALGISGTAKTGNAPAGTIRYVVFPNSGAGLGTIPSNSQIESKGSTLLKKAGLSRI